MEAPSRHRASRVTLARRISCQRDVTSARKNSCFIIVGEFYRFPSRRVSWGEFVWGRELGLGLLVPGVALYSGECFFFWFGSFISRFFPSFVYVLCGGLLVIIFIVIACGVVFSEGLCCILEGPYSFFWGDLSSVMFLVWEYYISNFFCLCVCGILLLIIIIMMICRDVFYRSCIVSWRVQISIWFCPYFL